MPGAPLRAFFDIAIFARVRSRLRGRLTFSTPEGNLTPSRSAEESISHPDDRVISDAPTQHHIAHFSRMHRVVFSSAFLTFIKELRGVSADFPVVNTSVQLFEFFRVVTNSEVVLIPVSYD